MSSSAKCTHSNISGEENSNTSSDRPAAGSQMEVATEKDICMETRNTIDATVNCDAKRSLSSSENVTLCKAKTNCHAQVNSVTKRGHAPLPATPIVPAEANQISRHNENLSKINTASESYKPDTQELAFPNLMDEAAEKRKKQGREGTCRLSSLKNNEPRRNPKNANIGNNENSRANHQIHTLYNKINNLSHYLSKISNNKTKIEEMSSVASTSTTSLHTSIQTFEKRAEKCMLDMALLLDDSRNQLATANSVDDFNGGEEELSALMGSVDHAPSISDSETCSHHNDFVADNDAKVDSNTDGAMQLSSHHPDTSVDISAATAVLVNFPEEAIQDPTLLDSCDSEEDEEGSSSAFSLSGGTSSESWRSKCLSQNGANSSLESPSNSDPDVADIGASAVSILRRNWMAHSVSNYSDDSSCGHFDSSEIDCENESNANSNKSKSKYPHYDDDGGREEESKSCNVYYLPRHLISPPRVKRSFPLLGGSVGPGGVVVQISKEESNEELQETAGSVTEESHDHEYDSLHTSREHVGFDFQRGSRCNVDESHNGYSMDCHMKELLIRHRCVPKHCTSVSSSSPSPPHSLSSSATYPPSSLYCYQHKESPSELYFADTEDATSLTHSYHTSSVMSNDDGTDDIVQHFQFQSPPTRVVSLDQENSKASMLDDGETLYDIESNCSADGIVRGDCIISILDCPGKKKRKRKTKNPGYFWSSNGIGSAWNPGKEKCRKSYVGDGTLKGYYIGKVKSPKRSIDNNNSITSLLNNNATVMCSRESEYGETGYRFTWGGNAVLDAIWRMRRLRRDIEEEIVSSPIRRYRSVLSPQSTRTRFLLSNKSNDVSPRSPSSKTNVSAKDDSKNMDSPVRVQKIMSNRSSPSKDPSWGEAHESRTEATTPSPISSKRSFTVDEDRLYVKHISDQVEHIEGFALTHLKRDEFGDALELFEKIMFLFLKKVEENKERRKRDLKCEAYLGTTLHNIGIVHLMSGRYYAAVEAFQNAMDVRKNCLGNKNEKYMASMSKLGVTYYALEKFTLAREVFEGALHLLKSVPHSSLTLLAEVFNNIGCVHFENGQCSVALKNFKESLELQSALLVETEHNTSTVRAKTLLAKFAISKANIGYIYLKLKRWNAAITTFEESLLHQKLFLDDCDSFVMATMDQLAYAYLRKGNKEKSIKIYGQMLRIQIQTFGAEHIECTQTLTKISLLHSEHRRFDRSMSCITKVNECRIQNNDPRQHERFAKLLKVEKLS